MFMFKVETIGDAYCVAAGLHKRSRTHAEQTAWMALSMIDACASHKTHMGQPIRVRVFASNLLFFSLAHSLQKHIFVRIALCGRARCQKSRRRDVRSSDFIRPVKFKSKQKTPADFIAWCTAIAHLENQLCEEFKRDLCLFPCNARCDLHSKGFRQYHTGSFLTIGERAAAQTDADWSYLISDRVASFPAIWLKPKFKQCAIFATQTNYLLFACILKFLNQSKYS